MLILSKLTTKQKFQEITEFSDCDTIAADVCVFFRIDNVHTEEELEKYFALAKQLQEHEIPYSVLVAQRGYCSKVKGYSFLDQTEVYKNEEYKMLMSLPRNIVLDETIKQEKMAEYVAKMEEYEKVWQNGKAVLYLGEEQMEYICSQTYHTQDTEYKESLLPLHVLLLMFANFQAQYIMFQENNYPNLAILQHIANYYLLDTKILAIAQSYMQIQHLSCITESKKLSNSLGIDGVIMQDLLNTESFGQLIIESDDT